MPKIRIKNFKDSSLSAYNDKSIYFNDGYEGDPRLKIVTSGSLSLVREKLLGQTGKYNNIEILNSTDVTSNDPYNDNFTLEFKEFNDVASIIDLPITQLENKDEFYVTTDESLLGSTIPESLHSKLIPSRIFSNSFIKKPNYINLKKLLINKISSKKCVDKGEIKENIKEIEFKPFVDKDVYKNIDSAFKNETLIFENKEYDVGDQKRIEIELDFSNSVDAFLLNTLSFYKSGNNYYNIEDVNVEENVFVSDEVKFLDTGLSISSHFMPNVIWNDIDRRWEYNSIVEEIGSPHISAKRFNIENNTFFYPNAITNKYDLGETNSLKTRSNLFDFVNKFLSIQPILFTESFDHNNSLITDEYNSRQNLITNTFGFPNSTLWKTNPSHEIKMEKYIPAEFLLEKVIFEGNVDLDVESPTKKGAVLNSESSVSGAQLYNNQTEFVDEHVFNIKESDYLSASINFYITRIKKNSKRKKKLFVPKLDAYIKTSLAFPSLFTPNLTWGTGSEEQNDSNPYIDTQFEDVRKPIKIFDSLQGDYLTETLGQGVTSFPTSLMSSIYFDVKRDTFNNLTDDRRKNQKRFFYFENIANPNDIDVNNDNIFCINQEKGNDASFSLYDDLSLSESFLIQSNSNSLQYDDQIENELITHNSLSFLVSKNGFSNNIKKERINSENIVELESVDKPSIKVRDYKFNISKMLNKRSEDNTSHTSESLFNLPNNYINRTDAVIQNARSVIKYNYEEIRSLMSKFNVGSSFFNTVGNVNYLFGIPEGMFADNTLSLITDPSDPNYYKTVTPDIICAFNNNDTEWNVNIKILYDESVTISGTGNFFNYLTSRETGLGNNSLYVNFINFACLKNKSFVTSLLDSNSFNSLLTDIESISIYQNNVVGQSEFFDSLSVGNKTRAFIRLLTLTLFNCQNNFGTNKTKTAFDNVSHYEEDLSNYENVNIEKFYSSLFTFNSDYSYNVDILSLSDIDSHIIFPSNFPIPVYDADPLYIKNVTPLSNFLFFESGFIRERKYSLIQPEQSLLTQEEIGILNYSEIDLDNRVAKRRKVYTSDVGDKIVSKSGKTIVESAKNKNENLLYVLKNSDSINVGINMFTGFNKVLSRARIKDKLKITLIGNELHEKNIDESSMSSMIKKSFSGSQRFKSFISKNSKDKYFVVNEIKNGNYIADSVMPSLDRIIEKSSLEIQSTNIFKTDFTHEYMLSNNIVVNKKSYPIIFSNKIKEISNNKFSINDWHTLFYFAKHKDLLTDKKRNNAVTVLKNILGTNDLTLYLYVDEESFSFRRSHDKFLSLSKSSDVIGSEQLRFTPFTYILPKTLDYSYYNEETQNYVTNELYNEGIPLSYDYDDNLLNVDNDSFKYTFSSTDLTSSVSLSNLEKFAELNSDNSNNTYITCQYLTLPNNFNYYYNINKHSNKNSKTFRFESSKNYDSYLTNGWCIVIENPSLNKNTSGAIIRNIIDKVSKQDYDSMEKYDFFYSSNDFAILYDETFRILVDKNNYNTFNFYIAFDFNINTCYFILPIVRNNTTNLFVDSTVSADVVCVDDYKQLFLNDSPNMSKTSNVYNILPMSIKILENHANIHSSGVGSDYLSGLGDYINSLFEDSDIIDLYIPKYNLSYPSNELLNNPLIHSNDADIMRLVEDEKYLMHNNSVNSFELLESIDKKLFSERLDILDLRSSSLENITKYRINKNIKESNVYKKSGNSFVKTNTIVKYEIIDEKVLLPNKNALSEVSYVDVIGIKDKHEDMYGVNIFNTLSAPEFNKDDVLRIYDEKFLNIRTLSNNNNFNFPKIDIDIPGVISGGINIDYTYYGLNHTDNVFEGAVSIHNYGTPVSLISDQQSASINKFLYSYSRNKKYRFPIDQTSGFKYGVYNPNPVGFSVKFNTNHYGSFKDKTYDTQNYAEVTYQGLASIQKFCVNKLFINQYYEYIDDIDQHFEENLLFKGSNKDPHERMFYPYIESTTQADNSDLSYMYI